MRAPGRVFALSQPGIVAEGEGSNAVVGGTFLVYTSWARVLFDSGSTHLSYLHHLYVHWA